MGLGGKAVFTQEARHLELELELESFLQRGVGYGMFLTCIRRWLFRRVIDAINSGHGFLPTHTRVAFSLSVRRVTAAVEVRRYWR